MGGAEDQGWGNWRGLGFVRLPRPGQAGAWVSARSRAVVLSVARGLLRLRFLPVVPTLGPHYLGHHRVEEDRACVDAPGPPQIAPNVGRFAGDLAIGKHEAEGLILGRGSGRDVTVPQAVDVAPLEEAGRGAKNEIHVAGDVTILEVLAAAICQNGILPAKKPAVAKRCAVTIQPDGQRLALGTGAVFKGDVLGREIVGINGSRGRAKGADGFAPRARQVRVQVIA